MLITLRVVMPAGNTVKTKLIPIDDDGILLEKYIRPFESSEEDSEDEADEESEDEPIGQTAARAGRRVPRSGVVSSRIPQRGRIPQRQRQSRIPQAPLAPLDEDEDEDADEEGGSSN